MDRLGVSQLFSQMIGQVSTLENLVPELRAALTHFAYCAHYIHARLLPLLLARAPGGQRWPWRKEKQWKTSWKHPYSMILKPSSRPRRAETVECWMISQAPKHPWTVQMERPPESCGVTLKSNFDWPDQLESKQMKRSRTQSVFKNSSTLVDSCGIRASPTSAALGLIQG